MEERDIPLLFWSICWSVVTNHLQIQKSRSHTKRHIAIVFIDTTMKETWGGGPFVCPGSGIILTLTLPFTPSAAQRVLSRSSLRLKNATLEVKAVDPLPSPPISHPPEEPTWLLMTGLPPGADAQCVREYVDGVAQCDLQNIVFGARPGTALLTFDGSPSKQCNRIGCQFSRES